MSRTQKKPYIQALTVKELENGTQEIGTLGFYDQKVGKKMPAQNPPQDRETADAVHLTGAVMAVAGKTKIADAVRGVNDSNKKPYIQALTVKELGNGTQEIGTLGFYDQKEDKKMPAQGHPQDHETAVAARPTGAVTATLAGKTTIADAVRGVNDSNKKPYIQDGQRYEQAIGEAGSAGRRNWRAATG